jgi:hypothetical protein
MSCFYFYLLSFSFYKTGEQEVRAGPAQEGSWYQWEGVRGGERVSEGEYSAKKCMNMYVNVKVLPVETIPEMGRGIKESSGGGEFKYEYIVRTFVNATQHNNKGENVNY